MIIISTLKGNFLKRNLLKVNMTIKFVLVLVFMYVINGNPPKLESGEYTLEDPNVASFPGEFLMDIDGDNDMIGISMIGDEYQWMLLGLGSETLDDIVCYLYHLDNESQEMILSRILIENGIPTEYLGKVRQWSAQVTNGYVMASFPRPFKVPGKDFDIKHKLDELPFVIAVGNGPEFNDLNDATMASYTIKLQHKLPPTSPPTLSPVVYDPFSRFGGGFGNDNDRFGGGFGMNPRGNMFENRQNPFPNDNNVNNQDRFGNDYNPFNNNNNQDRFQENHNRFNNNQNRFADARPNQDFYASNQQERNQGNNNDFYTNGFNQC